MFWQLEAFSECQNNSLNDVPSLRQSGTHRILCADFCAQRKNPHTALMKNTRANAGSA